MRFIQRGGSSELGRHRMPLMDTTPSASPHTAMKGAMAAKVPGFIP